MLSFWHNARENATYLRYCRIQTFFLLQECITEKVASAVREGLHRGCSR